MTEQVMSKLQITQAFRRGMSWGRKGIFRGKLCIEQSDEDIVEVIQNLIGFALEGKLTEEVLRQDIGIIVGFVLSCPEIFKMQMEVTDAS